MVHLPLFNFLSKRLIDKKLTSNDTIHIRLAGVDAPEVSLSVIQKIDVCLLEYSLDLTLWQACPTICCRSIVVFERQDIGSESLG